MVMIDNSFKLCQHQLHDQLSQKLEPFFLEWERKTVRKKPQVDANANGEAENNMDPKILIRFNLLA